MIRRRRSHKDEQPTEIAPALADDEPGSAAGHQCHLCDSSMGSEATTEAGWAVTELITDIRKLREAAQALAEEHKQAWDKPRPDGVAESGIVDEAVVRLGEHADAGAELLRRVHDFVHDFVPTWPRQQTTRWARKSQKLLDRAQMLRWNEPY